MDLDLNAREETILAHLDTIVKAAIPSLREGSPVSGCYDPALMAALRQSGLLDLAQDGAQGRLGAMLVIQAVAKAVGMVPVGLHAMLVPALFHTPPMDLVAIRRAGRDVPVAFAPYAGILIEVGAEVARAYRVCPERARAVASHYVTRRGHPDVPQSAPLLGTWPAALVVRRWQLALAGEILGTMSGALDHLVSYLIGRRQFGRELGSFQAVQHRLAELAVTLEALRCLAFEAAWADSDELAASAAAYAASAARTTCLEAHQLSGAMGFTLESGLYAWTLRLQALSVEAGGSQFHALVAAASRWGGAKACLSASGSSRKGAQPALVAADLQVE
jgi:alkylation response protein AidB-like acyl-CoA dehydrogenase